MQVFPLLSQSPAHLVQCAGHLQGHLQLSFESNSPMHQKLQRSLEGAVELEDGHQNLVLFRTGCQPFWPSNKPTQKPAQQYVGRVDATHLLGVGQAALRLCRGRTPDYVSIFSDHRIDQVFRCFKLVQLCPRSGQDLVLRVGGRANEDDGDELRLQVEALVRDLLQVMSQHDLRILHLLLPGFRELSGSLWVTFLSQGLDQLPLLLTVGMQVSQQACIRLALLPFFGRGLGELLQLSARRGGGRGRFRQRRHLRLPPSEKCSLSCFPQPRVDFSSRQLCHHGLARTISCPVHSLNFANQRGHLVHALAVHILHGGEDVRLRRRTIGQDLEQTLQRGHFRRGLLSSAQHLFNGERLLDFTRGFPNTEHERDLRSKDSE